MTEPAAQQIPSPVAPGAITLIEGTAFCVCLPSGDIVPGGTDGVFYRDTRLASRWELLVDGDQVEPMAVLPAQPFSATFIGRSRPRPGRAESTVLVARTRYVGDGMREDITVQNFAEEAIGVHVSLLAESDLAGIFDVKAGRGTGTRQCTVDAARDGLVISCRLHDRLRGVRVSALGAAVNAGGLSFTVVVEPRGTWQTSVLIQPMVDGQVLAPRFPPDQPIEQAGPTQRQQTWERDSPVAATTCGSLSRTLRRSRADLGSLRIFNSDSPGRPATVAAGAPWFMTVFGRDSALASCMALPLDQSLALGTARTLAEIQGEQVDPLTEEEPGKIIHEVRHGESVSGAADSAYYGSVDATPLFVMLLGELHRWGVLPGPAAEELLPSADRAITWIEKYGDLDGDGFVEYRRRTDRGLVNQGWKDSFDGINFANGTIAQAPIALAEVQGYVYAAYQARAHIARDMGDAGTARRYEERAAVLKRAFNEAFWLPSEGWYAVGLDRDKRPIDALASNMGHCLYTGIIDADKAAIVADQLMSPQMFTGWGIRTLASSMRAYNPMSYHNGSVWPHDNAIIAAGLMRYGFTDHAQRVALSVLDAAQAFDHRLPELFCGFGRAAYPRPLPYPTSCSPQAWASATPLQLLRTLLRFEPCVPCHQFGIAPALPEELGEIRIDRLPFASGRVSIRASGDSVEVNGLPPDIELTRGPTPNLPPGGRVNETRRLAVPDGRRRLRIAFVMPPWFDVPPDGYGGIELMAGDLIDALVHRGNDVVMVGAGRNGTQARFLRTFEQAPSQRLGEPMPEMLQAAWAGRYLDELDVDVIHDHSLAGPLAARGRRAPTVVTAHGPVDGDVGSYYEKISPDVCLVAISDAQQQLGPRVTWGGTVHNAVNVAEFRFSPHKEDYVLFLGRFSPEKGAHLAIDAAGEADVPILLAGKVREQRELEYFRGEIEPRLGERARFVGEADMAAKQKLAGRARCLVFPICWDEPFGMVMVEAMACGTPVVALNRGAVPEVIVDGTTGFILDDPADLPAAIRKAARLDPGACRSHVERNFNATTMAEGYERVYAQTVARGILDRTRQRRRGEV